MDLERGADPRAEMDGASRVGVVGRETERQRVAGCK